MDIYKDIRPYHDDEVSHIVDRLLNDKQFIAVVGKFRFPNASEIVPWLIRFIVRFAVKKQIGKINTVSEFQAVVASYMDRLVETSTTKLSHSGLEKLDPKKAYLFISNHRDIAMDPAFTNYVIFHGGLNTSRIAIGDNLLKKPFVTDILRLNKSFIVKRSIKGVKEILRASKQLSAYICHSLSDDNVSIWIAQREGRAKNAIDKTDPAIIKMLLISQPKKASSEQIIEYVRKLNIVPVSVSYEYDPCDELKAKELYLIEKEGFFEKDDNTDIHSIAEGLIGKKGHVHVSFGEPLMPSSASPDQIALEIDRQIISRYHLHPSNYIAEQILIKGIGKVSYADLQDKIPLDKSAWERKIAEFDGRLSRINKDYHPYVLAMYANSVINQNALSAV